MEKLIHDYLRILDIDPLGYFIRLINLSHHRSLDLSNISLRQVNTEKQAIHLYIFDDQIQPLLPNGGVVTIYSRNYNRLKFDSKPYIFIAHDVLRWSTNDDIQTELSMNEIVFDFYKFDSLSTSDVPLLFNNSPTNLRQLSIKPILSSNQYARFIFPYCSTGNNLVNPHTFAISDQDDNEIKRNLCYERKQTVKHFDSYPRRLTTAPKTIQLSKKI